jgi:signal transduction histidine kinase
MTAGKFIDHVSDPMVTLDGGVVREANAPAQRLFSAEEETLEGSPLADLFPQRAGLADRYERVLTHYEDIGGVVAGEVRHFDRDHETIAALLDGSDPAESDPDIGIYRDGRLEYFHLTTSCLEEAPVASDRLVTFRDITSVKRRERDLDFLMQVVSRVLRHNLRNDLTVARGYAATIEERGDETVAEMATQIRDTCTDLVQTSEMARSIQQAIDADERVPIDLSYEVDECVDDVLDGTTEATIETAVPDVTIRANPELPRALTDTIENAVRYNDPPRQVEVTAEREGAWVTLEIADNGEGIPQTELDALTHRGETDLVHGSGAGLWLTYTVVEESDGEITFDTDGDGTTVRMRLPTADPE